MKRVLLTLSVLFIISLCSVSAVGAGNNYVSLNLGTAILSDSDLTEPGATAEAEFDTGWGFGAAFGYDYGKMRSEVRAEVEIAYRTHDLDSITVTSPVSDTVSTDGEITSLAFMLNGYYDFENSTSLTPYLTGGLGVAKVEIDSLSVTGPGGVTVAIGSEDDTVFAYQLGAGIGYAVSETVTADLAYRLFATTDPKFGVTKAEYLTHNISVGVRFAF